MSNQDNVIMEEKKKICQYNTCLYKPVNAFAMMFSSCDKEIFVFF